MTPLAVLAPLLRALTGGRYPERPRRRTAEPKQFGREWDDLLSQLDLAQTAFQDVTASGSLHPHFHYRHFTKPKKDGGRREIVEPDVKLKCIQREIIARHFKAEIPHAAAIAYRKKMSIADHVWRARRAELLITADIEDFFPTTSAGRIEDWWRERVADGLARLLTLLTTYRGGLPQGRRPVRA